MRQDFIEQQIPIPLRGEFSLLHGKLVRCAGSRDYFSVWIAVDDVKTLRRHKNFMTS